MRGYRSWWFRAGMVAVVLLAPAAEARAQGGVGTGPLTASLATTEPQTGVFSMGAFKIAPGLSIREIGNDYNVFDENKDPKKDFVAAGTPDLSAFTKLRFVQLSVYGGSEMQYYQKYTSERSIGLALKGRADILIGRLRPFVGGGYTRNRARPNGEISVRANRLEDELSGGVAFDWSEHGEFFVAAVRMRTDYKEAVESDVDLGLALGRQSTDYMAGLKTDVTTLASLQVRGGYRKDEFKFEPIRNGDSRSATIVFSILPQALVSGQVTVGFQDYKPVDPLVKAYRGATGSAFLTYSFLEVGRINIGANRNFEYSFDIAEAYYIEDSVTAVYTHRLRGAFDLQIRGNWAVYDYGNRDGVLGHRDTLESANGSLGYNLRNRTRIGVNYEYARRRAEVEERNYLRRRVYLNWAFAF